MTQVPDEKTVQFAWFLSGRQDLFPGIHTEHEHAQLCAGIARLIVDKYWPAWQSHPDYHPGEWSDSFDPTAVAIYRHEPYRGHDESLMIAGVNDLLAPAQMEWGRRTLGEFVCLRPILAEIPVHPYQICYISWSLKGSGKAFRCRMELKHFLPRRYYPLVSLARKCAHLPKTFHLGAWLLNERSGQYVDLTDRASLPGWYTSTTRDTFNYRRFLELAGTHLTGLEAYMTREKFWQAATGQCHPDEVQGMVTHQIDLL